ncbi:MAG: acetyl-CoA carboxylase biotin carboxyl carrier protein subunit [Mogibacterium sp.]|nr:acetyl-CoA carboxylase biotin carboxyl carrier protein subunit [Mogibacterium sp.]
METYIIRVNGTEYEVEVEKKGEAGSSAAASSVGVQPALSPKAERAAKKAAAAGEPVTCGTSGKVFKIVSHEGQEVKSGDTIIVLEAMKMEIPVVAPKDGTVSKIVVSEGDSTSSGQTVAYIS